MHKIYSQLKGFCVFSFTSYCYENISFGFFNMSLKTFSCGDGKGYGVGKGDGKFLIEMLPYYKSAFGKDIAEAEYNNLISPYEEITFDEDA